MSAAPVGALAYQLASGNKHVRIPKFILQKSVSRRALAVAIHSVLPMLEAAEKVVRPRLAWINHTIARRAVGLFLFLLALAIAYPLFGFNPLHATSVFVVALGMAEQDGLAVLAGIAIGVVSLATLATSGFTAKTLRSKASRWLRKVGRKIGLEALARHLRRRGYKVLARVITFQWSELLLLWDPEKSKNNRGRVDANGTSSVPALVRTTVDAGKTLREMIAKLAPDAASADRIVQHPLFKYLADLPCRRQ